MDRETGERCYIGVGEANALRHVARSRWRCPFPDCTAVISTRGGSRRDHFFHPHGKAHASDGESEAHLGAKAMIAAWASAVCEGGAAAVEEEMLQLKEPQTARHRRADVMITWTDGRKTAFEVEYKNFLVEDWRDKQSDYDHEDVACVWLLGHTRVRHMETHTDDSGNEIALVRVPMLTHAWASSGRFILVVNPVTRQVGTVAGDRDFTIRPRPYREDSLWLRLDALDDCEADPLLGIVTPTMRTIMAAEQALMASEEEERRRWAEEKALQARREAEDDAEAARLRAESQERLRNEQAARRATAVRANVSYAVTPGGAARPSSAELEEWAQTWLDHPLRAQCIARWGCIPAFLREPLSNDHGIVASHELWHCWMFAHFVDSKPVGSTFRVRDVLHALRQNGFSFYEPRLLLFPALQGFLHHIESLGYVQIGAHVTGHIHGDITVTRHVPVARVSGDTPVQQA